MTSSGAATPPPASARRRRRALAILAVYAVAIAFGVALFSGSIPGLGGHFTSNITLDGHPYYVDDYWMPLPPLGNTSSVPASADFQNVTFWFWTSGWNDLHASYVHGNGTELNGTTYSFLLANPESNASVSPLFLSPDAHFGAEWSGEFILQLLVEVPTA
jgi:hypothetical protein